MCILYVSVYSGRCTAGEERAAEGARQSHKNSLSLTTMKVSLIKLAEWANNSLLQETYCHIKCVTAGLDGYGYGFQSIIYMLIITLKNNNTYCIHGEISQYPNIGVWGLCLIFFKVRHAICKYLCILTATMNWFLRILGWCYLQISYRFFCKSYR